MYNLNNTIQENNTLVNLNKDSSLPIELPSSTCTTLVDNLEKQACIRETSDHPNKSISNLDAEKDTEIVQHYDSTDEDLYEINDVLETTSENQSPLSCSEDESSSEYQPESTSSDSNESEEEIEYFDNDEDMVSYILIYTYILNF